MGKLGGLILVPPSPEESNQVRQHTNQRDVQKLHFVDPNSGRRVSVYYSARYQAPILLPTPPTRHDNFPNRLNPPTFMPTWRHMYPNVPCALLSQYRKTKLSEFSGSKLPIIKGGIEEPLRKSTPRLNPSTNTANSNPEHHFDGSKRFPLQTVRSDIASRMRQERLLKTGGEEGKPALDYIFPSSGDQFEPLGYMEPSRNAHHILATNFDDFDNFEHWKKLSETNQRFFTDEPPGKMDVIYGAAAVVVGMGFGNEKHASIMKSRKATLVSSAVSPLLPFFTNDECTRMSKSLATEFSESVKSSFPKCDVSVKQWSAAQIGLQSFGINPTVFMAIIEEDHSLDRAKHYWMDVEATSNLVTKLKELAGAYEHSEEMRTKTSNDIHRIRLKMSTLLRILDFDRGEKKSSLEVKAEDMIRRGYFEDFICDLISGGPISTRPRQQGRLFYSIFKISKLPSSREPCPHLIEREKRSISDRVIQQMLIEELSVGVDSRLHIVALPGNPFIRPPPQQRPKLFRSTVSKRFSTLAVNAKATEKHIPSRVTIPENFFKLDSIHVKTCEELLGPEIDLHLQPTFSDLSTLPMWRGITKNFLPKYKTFFEPSTKGKHYEIEQSGPEIPNKAHIIKWKLCKVYSQGKLFSGEGSSAAPPAGVYHLHLRPELIGDEKMPTATIGGSLSLFLPNSDLDVQKFADLMRIDLATLIEIRRENLSTSFKSGNADSTQLPLNFKTSLGFLLKHVYDFQTLSVSDAVEFFWEFKNAIHRQFFNRMADSHVKDSWWMDHVEKWNEWFERWPRLKATTFSILEVDTSLHSVVIKGLVNIHGGDNSDTGRRMPSRGNMLKELIVRFLAKETEDIYGWVHLAPDHPIQTARPFKNQKALKQDITQPKGLLSQRQGKYSAKKAKHIKKSTPTEVIVAQRSSVPTDELSSLKADVPTAEDFPQTVDMVSKKDSLSDLGSETLGLARDQSLSSIVPSTSDEVPEIESPPLL